MPLIAGFAYADNICYKQSQFDPFENCSSIDEALDVYHEMVLSEHRYGVKIDPSDPNYFLEFVQEAENLQKVWALSSGQEDVFLESTKGLPGNCFELAETIVAGNYSDLCF